MKAKAATANSQNEKHSTIEVESVQPEVARSPSVEEIRQRAYEIHLERGGMHGCDQDDWLRAERELAKNYPAS